MDTASPERWDNERGDHAARRRAGILAQREREQSRDPVLGRRAGDDDYKYDFKYFHNHLHLLNVHHHHGSGDYDIIVHNHDGPGHHYHIIHSTHYHTGDYYNYGPADHDHSVLRGHAVLGLQDDGEQGVRTANTPVHGCPFGSVGCSWPRPGDSGWCHACWSQTQADLR